MNKKATGLPVNVMIIAIIAIVVLLVVVLIFTGQMGKIIPGLDQSTCQAQSGTCHDLAFVCTDGGMKAYGMGCPDDPTNFPDNKYCCYPKPTG